MQALDHSPALSPDRSGAVFDPLAVDLALFGCWEAAPGYRVAMPADDPLADEVRGLVLETKSAEAVRVSAAEELRRLLNEMTVEMRSQFEGFRDMRVAAERLLDSGDEQACPCRHQGRHRRHVADRPDAGKGRQPATPARPRPCGRGGARRRRERIRGGEGTAPETYQGAGA